MVNFAQSDTNIATYGNDVINNRFLKPDRKKHLNSHESLQLPTFVIARMLMIPRQRDVMVSD